MSRPSLPRHLLCTSLTATALISASLANAAVPGRVTDSNGNPIVGADIEIIGKNLIISTDDSGNFRIDLPVEELDEIHVEAAGYSHQVLHLHGEADAQGLTIQLQRAAIEQVDVIGLPLHASTMESAQPIAVLSGEELREQQADTLGDTLKNVTGVHSSYYGGVSSSPVIRGLNGPRVLISQNGLDVGDVSRVGPDHVVSTETANAQQVEVLRGPATLFYGSGAIGGVVNVVDNRVPSNSDFNASWAASHNSVNDGDNVSASVTGGGERFALHADGSWLDTNDVDIPGVALLETEEEHEEEGHEEHRSGVLENSAVHDEAFNVGGSYLLDNGYIGLSYGRLDRRNGIPGHVHEHDEEEEEEVLEEEEEINVESDLNQDRWQLLSELSFDGDFLAGINTRLGYTDYQHRELENDEAATLFDSQTTQVRTDILHQELGGWRGAFSLELKQTDFEASGEEAFTPASTTDTIAAALVEEFHQGDLTWQLGARIERVEIDAESFSLHEHEDELLEEETEEESVPESMDFTPISLSAGVVWDFHPQYNLGLSLTHAERAPTAAELYSAGAHIGTSSYEVGALYELHEEDGELHLESAGNADEEVSNNIDVSLRKHSGDFGFVINLFYNQIDDFYYQSATAYTSEALHSEEEEEAGEEEHEHESDLPIYVYEQADATLYGLEAEAHWQLAAPWQLKVWGDATRGKLDDGGNLPRMPPVRLGSQLSWETLNWRVSADVSHYFDQTRTAALETETDGYTLVDANVSYTFSGRNNDVTVYLKGENLTDEEARVHTSFLKDKALLPGRGIIFGVRGSF